MRFTEFHMILRRWSFSEIKKCSHGKHPHYFVKRIRRFRLFYEDGNKHIRPGRHFVYLDLEIRYQIRTDKCYSSACFLADNFIFSSSALPLMRVPEFFNILILFLKVMTDPMDFQAILFFLPPTLPL